jgi:hypothetical protein
MGMAMMKAIREIIVLGGVILLIVAFYWTPKTNRKWMIWLGIFVTALLVYLLAVR